MVMIGHQLKRIQLILLNLEDFVQDSLERLEVSILVKDRCPKISAVQCVKQPAGFIGAGWSRDADSPGLSNALD